MMTPQLPAWALNRGVRRAAFVLALLCPLSLVTMSGNAQTLTVLHSFTGGGDGAKPYSGVTLDGHGHLYGTTAYGRNGGGVVYRLTRTNGAWTFAPLYKFGSGNDAAVPYAGVVFGPDGSLYGTTVAGGVVWELTP